MTSLYSMATRPWFDFSIALLVVATSVGTAPGKEPQFTFIENSVGISQVVDMNQHGQIVGRKEVALDPLGLGQVPYFFANGEEQRIEVLAGYTNVDPEAISDDGTVVGFVSRSLTHPAGSLQAFCWNAQTDQTIGLGTLPGHRGSHALDISADGHWIVGYSTGSNPPRMLPCVWRKTSTAWKCSSLTTIHDYNPVLLASRVVISDDGKQIAACITARIASGEFPMYESSLFKWQQNEAGKWKHRQLRDGPCRLYGINNQGMLTGSVILNNHRRAFVINANEKFQLLDLLPGDQSSQVLANNNQGTVVGYSDDPYGPEGGPQAFVWSKDKPTPLKFPNTMMYSCAQAINDRGQIAGYVEKGSEVEDRSVSFIMSR